MSPHSSSQPWTFLMNALHLTLQRSTFFLSVFALGLWFCPQILVRHCPWRNFRNEPALGNTLAQVSPFYRESALRTLQNAHFRREEVPHDAGQLLAMYHAGQNDYLNNSKIILISNRTYTKFPGKWKNAFKVGNDNFENSKLMEGPACSLQVWSLIFSCLPSSVLSSLLLWSLLSSLIFSSSLVSSFISNLLFFSDSFFLMKEMTEISAQNHNSGMQPGMPLVAQDLTH